MAIEPVLGSSRRKKAGVEAVEEDVAESWEDELEHPDEPVISSSKFTLAANNQSEHATLDSECHADSPKQNSIKDAAGDPRLATDEWGGRGDRGTGGESGRRPDKSTAVASRLIAAAIGQNAPRATREQREYDRAVRMQAQKKREEAKKLALEEEERAKLARQAIWDD